MPTPAQQAQLDRRFAALDHEIAVDDELVDRWCDVPRTRFASWQDRAADDAGSRAYGEI